MIDKDKQKGTGRQGLVGNAPYVSKVSECSTFSLKQKPQFSGGEAVWKTYSSRVLCRWERIRLRALVGLFIKGFSVLFLQEEKPLEHI